MFNALPGALVARVAGQLSIREQARLRAVDRACRRAVDDAPELFLHLRPLMQDLFFLAAQPPGEAGALARTLTRHARVLPHVPSLDLRDIDPTWASLAFAPRLGRLARLFAGGARARPGPVPDALGELRALRSLALAPYPGLDALPCALTRLERLTDLTVDCRDLPELPDWLADCRALRLVFAWYQAPHVPRRLATRPTLAVWLQRLPQMPIMLRLA